MSTVDAEQTVSAVANRRTSRVAISLVGIGALSLLWGGWLWRADRSYRTAILAIEVEMANGRFGIAARELNKLLDQNPVDAEAAILLGRCEKERGRIKAAGEALARVSPGSELSHKASCRSAAAFCVASRVPASITRSKPSFASHSRSQARFLAGSPIQEASVP